MPVLNLNILKVFYGFVSSFLKHYSFFPFLQWRNIFVFPACIIPLELPFINQVKERRVLSLSFRFHCKDMQVLSAPFTLVTERLCRESRRTYGSFSGMSQKRSVQQPLLNSSKPAELENTIHCSWHSEKSHQCCFCETQACCILTDPKGTHSSENVDRERSKHTHHVFTDIIAMKVEDFLNPFLFFHGNSKNICFLEHLS